MREYLVEGVAGGFPFIVDRTKPMVSESKPGGGSFTRIPGRFSVCDCINGNNRRYAKRVWEKNLQPGSILQESIKRNAAFGLLEHPKDGLISLQSPISHQVTKAELIESKDAAGKTVYEVVGEISLYNPNLVPESAKLLGLIEGGYNPLVSSRGYGSLTKAADGVDEVQEDYVCESWDVVIKPSFEQAELKPNREIATSDTNARMAAQAQPESKAAPVPEKSLSENKNLKESSPSTGAAASAAAASALQKKSNSMELNEIKGRIATMESMDPSKLPLTRFTESLTQIEELHQEVAQFAAADPKQAYTGQKLHQQLDAVASRFSESAQAPVKQAKKLQENNMKLMKVINAVAATALTYKKRLGESVKTSTNSQKLKEELTRRGQGWKKIAEDRSSKLSVMEKDWNDSCEALELMSRRYHEDTTELARRLIVLEFKEKAATPEIQKRLKEATRLRQIAAIRETLEGKQPAISEEDGKSTGVGKPADGAAPSMAKKGDKKKAGEGECVASEPGKVTNESKASAPAPVVEAKTGNTDANVVSEAKLMYSTRDPRSMNESVDLVKRLSTATAK